MSTAVKAVKKISFGSLLGVVSVFHLKRGFRSVKTIILAVVMLLPIGGGVLYAMGDGTNGVEIYQDLVNHITLGLLLPLVCLFQGGPAIVEEIEGRTATYLFLRPVSKPAIFLGKYLAASIISTVLVVVPVIIMFFVLYAAGEPPDNAFKILAQTVVSHVVGCFSYTAVFAALGALFGWSLLTGIIFGTLGDWCLSLVPVLEFGTQNYHLRNAASLVDTAKLGPLDRFVLDAPIEIPIWSSYTVVLGVIVVSLAAGAYIFNERQYFG